jgi:hypothetical protein
MKTTTVFSKPQPVDAVLAAFPGSVKHLMPKWDEIPEEFHHGHTPWNKLQSRWFFTGLPKETVWVPKEGIDKDVALRHLKTIQGSFEPKHEHKEAAVAYLMSLWFESVTTPEAK